MILTFNFNYVHREFIWLHLLNNCLDNIYVYWAGLYFRRLSHTHIQALRIYMIVITFRMAFIASLFRVGCVCTATAACGSEWWHYTFILKWCKRKIMWNPTVSTSLILIQFAITVYRRVCDMIAVWLLAMRYTESSKRRYVYLHVLKYSFYQNENCFLIKTKGWGMKEIIVPRFP